MYSNNIMPNYRMNMPRKGFGLRNNDDRFFGGGFAVPFLLGGITGSLLTRPNFGGYQSYPTAVPFVVNNPYPYYYPYYSENYYYY